MPANTYLGEVAGVATNSKGHVFVYTRTGHAVATLGDERTFYHGGSRLFQFDQNGKFVKEIGQGLYAINFAQQVRVDPQDNIWIVDAGSNMVVKFDADGRVQLVLGRKPENIGVRPGPGVPARGGVPLALPGGSGGGRGGALEEAAAAAVAAARQCRAPGVGVPGDSFSQPSDVTWDRAGNIYVADGFGTNNRIAKFNKDGDFRSRGDRPDRGRAQFNRIRGIASDAQGNSTWPTPATIASRCSTARARSSRRSPTSARRRPSASRAARRSICTAPTPTIPRAWITARSTRCS